MADKDFMNSMEDFGKSAKSWMHEHPMATTNIGLVLAVLIMNSMVDSWVSKMVGPKFSDMVPLLVIIAEIVACNKY